MTTKRITFNIADFLRDLERCLEDDTEMIDDVVQTYKDFLKRAKEPVRKLAKDYTNKHPLVLENEVVASYIKACHRLNFDI